MSNSTTTYLLAKHVFLCMRDGAVVFLDLKADKYLAMDAAKVSHVINLPSQYHDDRELMGDGSTRRARSAAPEKSAHVLIEKGLLTIDPSLGKAVEYARVPTPESDFISIAPEKPPTIRPLDISRFFLATLSAYAALRLGSLEKVVTTVRLRGQKHRLNEPKLDLSIARRCSALFERMRPLFFSATDKCLFESLVLMNFLAKYDVYPSWVFGIQTSPFGAHCWVQYESVVFNDVAEHACEFTPILVV